MNRKRRTISNEELMVYFRLVEEWYFKDDHQKDDIKSKEEHPAD